MEKYSWKHAVTGCSAQVAGEVMKSIEERDGSITPQAFLEASRPEDSPTHGAFEWDDSVAAEKFRLTQSRHMINNITVKIISDGDDNPKEKHVAFVNVTDGRHKPAEYKSVNIALSESDSRDIVLRNAMAELEAFQKKYETLTELAEVFSAIEKVKKRSKK